jgi:hypothetical protein
MRTVSDADADCFAGDATATSNLFVHTVAKVAGQDESFLKTADLTVDANTYHVPFEYRRETDGGPFVDEDKEGDLTNNARRQIYWESTVIMLGEPNPTLVVDSTGKIVELVNVTVTDNFDPLWAEPDNPGGPQDRGRRHPVRPERRRPLPPTISSAHPAADLGQRRPVRLPGDVGL